MWSTEAKITWTHHPGHVLEYVAWFEYGGYKTFLRGCGNKDEFFEWYNALSVAKQPSE